MQYWIDAFASVLASGIPARFEHCVEPLDKWFRVNVTPVGHDRIATVYENITEEKRAEATLRESEERQVFLLKLSDALRPLTEPMEIQRVASRILREQLGADRVAYAELDPDEDLARLLAEDLAEGVAPLAHDTYRWSDFDPFGHSEAKQGRSITRADVQLVDDLTPAEKATFATVGFRALINVPLLKSGRLVAFIAVHFHHPRESTPTDIALVEETAERTWEGVERARAEAALRESEARLRHVIDSAREYAIVALDRAARITMWNDGAARLLGYSEEEILGRPGDIFFTPEDRKRGEPEREMRLAREQGRAENERWHIRKDGSRFWGSGVMLPMQDGGSADYLKIFRDQTKERLADERQQLLINELNHRVKNTLATVQAIASQSLRSHKVEKEARESLELRLLALASGHDVLTKESWTGADLRQLVTKALHAFRVVGEERVQVDGQRFYLSPKPALSITMALHELATNATKYGALSNDIGRIEISWMVDDDDAPHLHFRWREIGGPVVVAPDSKGFGSRLLERGLASELGANVRIEYASEGVVCTIDAPVAKLRRLESSAG